MRATGNVTIPEEPTIAFWEPIARTADGTFLDQIKGLENNRHRVKNMLNQENGGTTNAAVVFLTMLEGLVYTIGGIFGAAVHARTCVDGSTGENACATLS